MTAGETRSLVLARQFLGKRVEVIFDRPLGSAHPKYGFVYEVNYGYVEGTVAPDGECLDAYYLGVDVPLEKASGVVRAVVHRLNDDDDKLVVMPVEVVMDEGEIDKAVDFQEKWFEHEIVWS